MKKEMLACILALAYSLSHAAGFNCARAETKLEKIICANAELSALDSKLENAYAKALARDKETHDFVQESERNWIESLDGNCIDDISCIKDQYASRLVFLDAISTPEVAGSRFVLNNISKHYAFTIHMYGHCDIPPVGKDGACEGPGRVTVQAKNKQAAPQVIIMENIFLTIATNGRPLTNSAQMYDYQGVINVGDFNFDGPEDFAIQNGNHGSYGGPSYDVYLNKGETFEYSSALSELIAGSLGFFDIDPSSKTIKTFSKDGCCWHQTTTYKVIDDKPVEVERDVDDARSGSDEAYSYTEQLINGRWKQVSASGVRPDNYCEDDLLRANLKYGQPDTYAGQACKPIPNEHNAGVIATAYSSDWKEFGLNLFMVSLNDGTLLAKLMKSNEFSQTATATNSSPEHLAIDTGRFNLSKEHRAFGVRSDFRVLTAGDDTNFTLLSLYVRKGSAIIPVLEHLVVALSNNEMDIKRTLSMQSTNANGFADIVVHETENHRNDGHAVRHDFLVRYNGSTYILPKPLTVHP